MVSSYLDVFPVNKLIIISKAVGLTSLAFSVYCMQQFYVTSSIFLTAVEVRSSQHINTFFLGFWKFDITLLPSDTTQKSVHQWYMESCQRAGSDGVAITTFVNVWASLLPHIVINKPASDLCWTCQQNNNLIFKYSNSTMHILVICL